MFAPLLRTTPYRVAAPAPPRCGAVVAAWLCSTPARPTRATLKGSALQPKAVCALTARRWVRPTGRAHDRAVFYRNRRTGRAAPYPPRSGAGVCGCAVLRLRRAGWAGRAPACVGCCAPVFGGDSPTPTKRGDDTTRGKGRAVRAHRGAPLPSRGLLVAVPRVCWGVPVAPARDGGGGNLSPPPMPHKGCVPSRGCGGDAALRQKPPNTGRKPRKRGFSK